MNTGLPASSNREKRPLEKIQGNRYRLIYDLVNLIPAGRVATYGQIAGYIERCTPRMVGFAMAAVPQEIDVPWHRVINSKGMISIRANGEYDMMQRVLLEAEGVTFDEKERVDLAEVGWEGLCLD